MTQAKINRELLEAFLTGNRFKSTTIVKDAMKEADSVIPVYEYLIKESLYEVGKLWEFNKISVAAEHLATAITEAILNELYEGIISDHRLQKRAVVACVENEFHQVGIKMVADVFEKNGWDTYFLGANIPVRELVPFIKLHQPQMLALSLSIYFHIPVLEKMITEIRREFPHLPIIVGGQAFARGGSELVKKYNGVMFISNLFNLENFILNLNQHG